MKTVYLHAGLHKTGTSTIQRSLYNARTVLARAGILYPDLGINHSHRIVSCFSDEPERFHLNVRNGIYGQALAGFNEDTRQRLWAALTDTEYDKIVISGEGISRLTVDGLDRLWAFLTSANVSIVPVIYVRPPALVVSSLVQQAVKDGRTIPDRPYKLPGLNFRPRVEPILERADQGYVLFRQFDKQVASGSGLIRDFLTTIGCEALAHDVTPIKANQSLSDPAVRVLDRFNRRCPFWIGEGENRAINPERAVKPRPHVWAGALGGPPFRLDPDLCDKIENLHSSDKDWLEKVSGLDLSRQPPESRAEAEYAESELYDELARWLRVLIRAHANRDTARVEKAAQAIIMQAPSHWPIGDVLTRSANVC